MVEKYSVNEIKNRLLSHSMSVGALYELPKRDLLKVFLGYEEKVACGDGKKGRYAMLLVAAIFNEDTRLGEDLVGLTRERLEPPEQYPLLWYRG